MYYVAESLGNNRYSIGDTKDNSFEVLTETQMIEYTVAGVVIEGVGYSTSSELKSTGRFGSIRALGKKPKCDIVTGVFCNILTTKSFSAYVYDIDYSKRDLVYCIDINTGEFIKVFYKDIKSFVIINNIAPNVRTTIFSIVQSLSKQKANKEMIEKLNLENKVLTETVKQLQDSIKNNSGVLSLRQFKEYVQSRLSQVLKQYIQDLGYQLFEAPMCVSYREDDIFITYRKYLDFDVFPDFFTSRGNRKSEAELSRMKSYQVALNTFRQRLPITGVQLQEHIVGEDAHHLWYECWYRISLNGASLTPALAEKVISMLN